VPHLLVWRVECTAPEVEVEVSYGPRPEYGLVVPLLSAVDGGVIAGGGTGRRPGLGPASSEDEYVPSVSPSGHHVVISPTAVQCRMIGG
jgi:hypothetical protein